MQAMFQGASTVMLARLRKAVTASQAVREGIASHVQKEHERRERYAASRWADQAILGPFGQTGKPL